MDTLTSGQQQSESMANYTRRSTLHHPSDLQELIRTAPPRVQWKRDSWVATRDNPANGKAEKRWFFAGTVDYKQALTLAIAWQRGANVANRTGIHGKVRVERRQLALSRRLIKGKKEPRYELSIQANKGSGSGWQKIFLGTPTSIDQKRIDAAVATLHKRMELYRQRAAEIGQIAAAAEAKLLVAEAQPQTQLRLENVLIWNGVGEGISYFPRPTER